MILSGMMIDLVWTMYDNRRMMKFNYNVKQIF
jgi:hypothetical protein